MKPSVVIMDKLDPSERNPPGLQMMFDADRIIAGALEGDKTPTKYAGTPVSVMGEEPMEFRVSLSLGVIVGPDTKATAEMVRACTANYVLACCSSKSNSLVGKAVRSRKANGKYYQLGDGDSVTGFGIVDGKIEKMRPGDDDAPEAAPESEPTVIAEIPSSPVVEPTQAPEQPPLNGEDGT